MTPIQVRIRVRCTSCDMPFRLSQEQYRELVKRSRVALNCPHCAHGFEYSPLVASAKKKPAPPVRPSRAKGEAKAQPIAAASLVVPPIAAAPAAPAFPPPPFAPLGGGKPEPSNATPPPFAPLGGSPLLPMPAAPFPQGTAAPSGGETKKLTVNERWKQLPPWVQWTAIGVLVVVMAVVIFAIPTGGASVSPEPETPRRANITRTGPRKTAPAPTAKPRKTRNRNPERNPRVTRKKPRRSRLARTGTLRRDSHDARRDLWEDASLLPARPWPTCSTRMSRSRRF